MNKYILIIAFIFLHIVWGCKNENTSVYDVIQKESKLTEEILFNSKRIMHYKDWLILVMVIENDNELYNPYLIFYDKKLNMKSAAYLPGDIISINDKEIVVSKNPVRYKRKSQYVNDLPLDVNIKYIEKSGWSSKCNKIIRDIQLDSNQVNIKVIVERSENEYEGFDVENGYYIQENWNIQDTLLMDISSLEYDYNEKWSKISTYSYSKNSDYIVKDEMLLSSLSILNRSINKWWLNINTNPTK